MIFYTNSNSSMTMLCYAALCYATLRYDVKMIKVMSRVTELIVRCTLSIKTYLESGQLGSVRKLPLFVQVVESAVEWNPTVGEAAAHVVRGPSDCANTRGARPKSI